MAEESGEASPFSVAYVSCYMIELISTLGRAKQMPFLTLSFSS